MWQTLKDYILYPINKRSLIKRRAQLAELKTRVASAREQISVLQIGNASVGWAALEITLDFSNWCIVHALQSKEPFPLALGRKLELFRRGHNKVAALAPLKAAGAKLADEIAALSEARNDMIHGYAIESLSEETIEVYRHIVPRGPDAHKLTSEVRSYSPEELDELVRQAFTLAVRSADHFAAIAAATGHHDKIRDLTSKALVGAPGLRGAGIFRSRQ